MQIAHRHIYCISMKKHYCLLSEMKITGLDLLRVRLFYSLKNGSSFLMKHKNKKKNYFSMEEILESIFRVMILLFRKLTI